MSKTTPLHVAVHLRQLKGSLKMNPRAVEDVSFGEEHSSINRGVISDATDPTRVYTAANHGISPAYHQEEDANDISALTAKLLDLACGSDCIVQHQTPRLTRRKDEDCHTPRLHFLDTSTEFESCGDIVFQEISYYVREIGKSQTSICFIPVGFLDDEGKLILLPPNIYQALTTAVITCYK